MRRFVMGDVVPAREVASIRSERVEGINGLPADFLIGPDGVLLAVRYGRHASDHWSVTELLAHAN